MKVLEFCNATEIWIALKFKSQNFMYFENIFLKIYIIFDEKIFRRILGNGVLFVIIKI